MNKEKFEWKIGPQSQANELGAESGDSISNLNRNFIDKEHIDTKNSKRKFKVVFSISIALIITFIQFFLFKYLFYQDGGKLVAKEIAVVMPIKDLKKGQILKDDELTIKYMNIGALGDEVLLADEFENYLGQPLLIDVGSKIPIFKFMLASHQKNTDAREKIPIGKRLFYLKIESDLSAKSIAVGDNVDVIAHMDIPDFGKATETVLEAVQVVGIGEGTADNGTEVNSDVISFFLSPEEVKIMTFMKSYGNFSVYLRNPNDFSKTKNGAVTFNKFIENDRIKRIVGGDKFKIIQGINKHVDNNR